MPKPKKVHEPKETPKKTIRFWDKVLGLFVESGEETQKTEPGLIDKVGEIFIEPVKEKKKLTTEQKKIIHRHLIHPPEPDNELDDEARRKVQDLFSDEDKEDSDETRRS